MNEPTAFYPVKPKKGSEIVMEQIKAKISSGELPPGSKLASVVDLAANFGVGRSTVREALSALKAVGLLHIQHGGGTYVSRELPPEPDSVLLRLSDPEAFREVLEVRKYIETGCAALAARRRTDKDLQELEQILNDMSRSLDDEAASEQADVSFHLRLAQASGNAVLMQMMESLHKQIAEHMKETRRLWFYGQRASAERLLAEHTSIFQAIASGNELEASERMGSHIDKVDEVSKKFI